MRGAASADGRLAALPGGSGAARVFEVASGRESRIVRAGWAGVVVASAGKQQSILIGAMLSIGQFFGIMIQMFWREHAPPHFHALYGEHEALMDIRALEIIGGSLPERALSLTIEWAIEHRGNRQWAIEHRGELMEDWKLCQAKQQPNKIQPLE